MKLERSFSSSSNISRKSNEEAKKKLVEDVSLNKRKSVLIESKMQK